jgi:hypothetical protein
MIAYTGFATGTSCGYSTTAGWHDDSPTAGGFIIDEVSSTSDTLFYTIEFDTTKLKILKNAIKATEMLVTISRLFRASLQSLQSLIPKRLPVMIKRSLFCRSGYLPRKIRKIRKSR